MTKAERHAVIRERAAEAIRNLYHNATPEYPRNVPDDKQELFQEWLNDAASFEIEYIQDGGAYAKSRDAFRRILEHNASRSYNSEAARRYYVRKGLRDMDLERATNRHAAWERINEYGKLYTYGRGGRTLAPKNLIREHGGSRFSVNEDYAADIPIADVVDLIHVVESFNDYVEGWNKGIPEMWDEYLKANEPELEDVAELSTTD